MTPFWNDCTITRQHTVFGECPIFLQSASSLLNKTLGESQFCCLLHLGDSVTQSEFPCELEMNVKNLLSNL